MRWLTALAAAAICALPAGSAAADDLRLAAGASLGLQQRDDYGAGSRAALVPELVFFGYLARGAPRVYLRPGIRVGFTGSDQAEMPQAVQLREYDLEVAAELAVLHDGVVIPSLAFGAGTIGRWIQSDFQTPITTSDGTRFELLPAVHAQLGLGMPLARGGLVLEPFVRYDHVFGDDRVGWGIGLEATVAIR